MGSPEATSEASTADGPVKQDHVTMPPRLKPHDFNELYFSAHTEGHIPLALGKIHAITLQSCTPIALQYAANLDSVYGILQAPQ